MCAPSQHEAETCQTEQLKLIERIYLNNLNLFEKKTEIVQLVEIHINILASQLNNLNLKSLNESETNNEEIDTQLSIFQSFTRSCHEVVDKTKSSDICRLADDLHARARELQDMTLIKALPSPHIKFSASNVLDTLKEDQLNIVDVVYTVADFHAGVHI